MVCTEPEYPFQVSLSLETLRFCSSRSLNDISFSSFILRRVKDHSACARNVSYFMLELPVN